MRKEYGNLGYPAFYAYTGRRLAKDWSDFTIQGSTA